MNFISAEQQLLEFLTLCIDFLAVAASIFFPFSAGCVQRLIQEANIVVLPQSGVDIAIEAQCPGSVESVFFLRVCCSSTSKLVLVTIPLSFARLFFLNPCLFLLTFKAHCMKDGNGNMLFVFHFVIFFQMECSAKKSRTNNLIVKGES